MIDAIIDRIKWFLFRDPWYLMDNGIWFIHPACGKQSLMQWTHCPRCGKRMKKMRLMHAKQIKSQLVLKA